MTTLSQLKNHLATPQDFKTAQEAERRPERVVLPRLGKAVLLRRPPPLWFIFRGHLPQSLASTALASATEEKAATNPERPLQTPEELQRLARWVVDLLGEVMVKPRISLSPGPEEIAPELIADEDLNFIIRWAMGEVVTAGDRDQGLGVGNDNLQSPPASPRSYDLARFRGKR